MQETLCLVAMDAMGFFFWKVQVFHVWLHPPKDKLMGRAGAQPRRSLRRGSVRSQLRC